MKTLLSLSLFFVFAILAIIHFYWAIGGKWGLDNAIPKDLSGNPMLQPGAIDSTIIGLGLVAFALFYLFKSGITSITLPNYLELAGWIIPAIFILRAIGEFKYVGFFKSITTTTFSQFDTFYYSPLCLVIGVIGICIKMIK